MFKYVHVWQRWVFHNKKAMNMDLEWKTATKKDHPLCTIQQEARISFHWLIYQKASLKASLTTTIHSNHSQIRNHLNHIPISQTGRMHSSSIDTIYSTGSESLHDIKWSPLSDRKRGKGAMYTCSYFCLSKVYLRNRNSVHKNIRKDVINFG